MIIIAHRGNIDGPDSCNHDLKKIADGIGQGYYMELDLWKIDGNFYFGHDTPEKLICLDDFDHPKVFFHLKNLFLPRLKFADAFSIDHDNFVLTLRGRLWCNYGAGFAENSVVCAPELVKSEEPLENFLRSHQKAWGICTDYARTAKEILETIQ